MIIKRINGKRSLRWSSLVNRPTLHLSRSSLQCTVGHGQIANALGSSPSCPASHRYRKDRRAWSISSSHGSGDASTDAAAVRLPPQAKSTVNFCRMACTVNLGPCHPRRRRGNILNDTDPACPSRKCLVCRIDGLSTIICGVASVTRRCVKQAAPFERPFLKKLYRIHDTSYPSESEAIISYEDRLFEHSIFHSDLPSNSVATDPTSPLRGKHLSSGKSTRLDAIANKTEFCPTSAKLRST